MADKKLVGKIVHYYSKIDVAIVELSDTLRAGDKISIEGSENFQQVVDSMQIEHEAVDEAGKGESVGIKVKQRVHDGDKVFRLS